MTLRICINKKIDLGDKKKEWHNHKNEVKDIRWSDKYWQVYICCKYYRISYYIKINHVKNQYYKRFESFDVKYNIGFGKKFIQIGP